MAVGFLTVADGSDFDGVVSFQIEEHAVIAAAEAEARERVSGGFSFLISPARLVR